MNEGRCDPLKYLSAMYVFLQILAVAVFAIFDFQMGISKLSKLIFPYILIIFFASAIKLLALLFVMKRYPNEWQAFASRGFRTIGLGGFKSISLNVWFIVHYSGIVLLGVIGFLSFRSLLLSVLPVFINAIATHGALIIGRMSKA